jgi:CubicO group peptidase (beta-lactamase class C family)
MAYLQELSRATGTPAISVAVASQGRLVFSQGVGSADLDNLVSANGATVYNIGSVSKAVTAVAILQLVEQGKVGLDDTVQSYVPGFPDKGSPVTIRHLLTHTSGIRHYRATDFSDSMGENVKPISSFEEGIKIFKDDPLLFVPGKYYFYSSYAVNLLQGVVEKASGMAFEDYLRRYVWNPAGMLSTAFDVPERIISHRAKGYRVECGRTRNYPYGDVSYKFASGGMVSTVEDLVRFGIALNHERLLKADTIALMYRPIEAVAQFDENGPPQRMGFSQGLIWRISKDPAGQDYVHHCGTVKGYNACIVNYPDQDLVVAIAGNGHPVTPARREAMAIAQFFLPLPEGAKR